MSSWTLTFLLKVAVQLQTNRQGVALSFLETCDCALGEAFLLPSFLCDYGSSCDKTATFQTTEHAKPVSLTAAVNVLDTFIKASSLT